MENQVNLGDQTTQQIGQNPINQPVLTPEKPKINYLAITGVILVCFVVFGFGGYYLGKQSSQSQKYVSGRQNQVLPTATPQANNPTTTTTNPSSIPDPTVNWKTYTNQSYKFSFRYPEVWILKTDKPEYFLRLIDENAKEKILIYNGQFADGIDDPNSRFEYSEGYLDNQLIRIQKYYRNNKLGQVSYEVKISDEYILISFTNYLKETTDQILSTFKFTN